MSLHQKSVFWYNFSRVTLYFCVKITYADMDLLELILID